MPKQFVLTSGAIFETISAYPDVKCLWVAFSGGVDSHVLLHLLNEIRTQLVGVEIKAIHVDHGLQQQSKQWAVHCQQVCAGYDIPLTILQVDAKHDKGESPEDAARQARYDALASIIEKNDYIVTAHHQDDQCETLLIQLTRGCSAAGLAGMPNIARFKCGWLARPLLDFSSEQLIAYAKLAGLKWIEDPSNANDDFDRNYIRHRILPVLKSRWPKIVTTISRTARHSADVSQLLTQLAQIDIDKAQGSQINTLSVKILLSFDMNRRNNLIRNWIKNLGLPVPQTIHMKHINHDVLMAKCDAQPNVNWQGCTINRYRDLIYAMAPLLPHDTNQVLPWDFLQSISISGIGTLSAVKTRGSGLKNIHYENATVRFRQGGERCKPVGRMHTHELKKLFQEFNVPFWMRERVPLIFINDVLAGIVGYCYCEGFAAVEKENGFELKLTEAGVEYDI